MKKKANKKTVKDSSLNAHHFRGHLQGSNSCAVCRLRTLSEAAQAGDEEAAFVIWRVAVEAAESVETLRRSGNSVITKWLLCMNAWPVNITYPDRKRPWIKDLGSECNALPFSWRRMLYKNTPSRRILLRSFELIAALRDLAIEREVEKDRRLAKSYAELTAHEPLRLDDEVVAASFREILRKASNQWTHPENDDLETPAGDSVLRSASQLLDLLEITKTKPDVLVDTFASAALALRHSTDASAWYSLAKQILFFVTENQPEKNDVLKSLAPNRGVRKGNRDGEGLKENVQEIRARIFDDMLEAPLKKIVGQKHWPAAKG